MRGFLFYSECNYIKTTQNALERKYIKNKNTKEYVYNVSRMIYNYLVRYLNLANVIKHRRTKNV